MHQMHLQLEDCILTKNRGFLLATKEILHTKNIFAYIYLEYYWKGERN